MKGSNPFGRLNSNLYISNYFGKNNRTFIKYIGGKDTVLVIVFQVLKGATFEADVDPFYQNMQVPHYWDE